MVQKYPGGQSAGSRSARQVCQLVRACDGADRGGKPLGSSSWALWALVCRVSGDGPALQEPRADEVAAALAR